MGRRLTWLDDFNSLPDHEKEFYKELYEDMCTKCECNRIEEAKEAATRIEKWIQPRWKVARQNRKAAKSNLGLKK